MQSEDYLSSIGGKWTIINKCYNLRLTVRFYMEILQTQITLNFCMEIFQLQFPIILYMEMVQYQNIMISYIEILQITLRIYMEILH